MRLAAKRGRKAETRNEGGQSVEKDSTIRASDQLREKASTVRDDLRDLGRLTREAAQEKLADARQAGREKAAELEDRVESYVREKPLQSLLIAGGVGLLLGFLLRRR
jgi:ElaB/YqjD/DUF883 family membrane-anchored ribosome-binding protein